MEDLPGVERLLEIEIARGDFCKHDGSSGLLLNVKV